MLWLGIILLLILVTIIILLLWNKIDHITLLWVILLIVLAFILILISNYLFSGSRNVLGEDVIKQLLLVKDHLIHLDRQCYECICKHLVLAEALSDEKESIEFVDVSERIRQLLLNIRKYGATNENIETLDSLIVDIQKIRIIDHNLNRKRDLLQLRNPYFNLREILKQIELIEHYIAMGHPIEKQLLFVEALTEEGMTMNEKTKSIYKEVYDWLQKKKSEDYISQDFRRIRKDLTSFFPAIHERALIGENEELPEFMADCADNCNS